MGDISTGSTMDKASPSFWDDVMDEVDQGKRTLTSEEVVRLYDKWAEEGCYDKNTTENGYGALDVMENTLDDLLPKSAGRENVTLFDVGCCTGNSGQRLYEMGFRKVDALDPSSVSLKVAEQRGVYRTLYNDFMTAQPLDIPRDTYDAIILLGVMGPCHIPVEAFTEMIRLVKPGGYIVNQTRAVYLDRCEEYIRKWGPAIQGYVDSGKWRLLKEKRYSNHFDGRDGVLHVFQIC